MAGVIVKPRSRILHGHDWVFRSEVLKTHGGPGDGDLVSIHDPRGKPLGRAIYSANSPIAARRFSRRRSDLNRELFLQRIAAAWEHRVRAGVSNRPCRVVWSESDRLPGLVVDRYGPALVLQTHTAAMDARRDLIAACLLEIFSPLGVRGIVERNDAGMRTTEGLEPRKGILLGDAIREHRFTAAGAEVCADLLDGQKTGYYLDQIAACEAVAPLAADRRVLDLFANQGGFALACARAGAVSVTAVESGEVPAARLRENATTNNVAVKVQQNDAFQFLRTAKHSGQSFDLVILDPPSFTRGKGNLGHALRGYRELHLRAAQLLAPGGLLASFSCSHHVGHEAFLDSVRCGIADAGRTARLLRRLPQPPDHPVVLHLPESEYLQGILVEILPNMTKSLQLPTGRQTSG